MTAPDPVLDVHLYRELPSTQWVVELRKAGARLTVYRSAPDYRPAAFGVAEALTRFLGVPLTSEE